MSEELSRYVYELMQKDNKKEPQKRGDYLACPSCEAQVSNTANFCKNCGQRLKETK